MEHYDGTSDLLAELETCFDNPKFCDVRIVDNVGGQIHCMSWVLRKKSEVFDKMLASEMVEGIHKEICIADVDPRPLYQMMHCMHTGKYNITPQNFIPLKYLADKYNVPDLIKFCSEFETKKLEINETSCCPLLRDALQFSIKDVMDLCVDYIVYEMDNVCDRADFVALSYPVISLLKGYAQSELFTDDTESVDCMWFVVGLIKWVESSIAQREKYLVPLLQDLDFGCSEVDEIAHLFSYKCIMDAPVLWAKLVGPLGKQRAQLAPKKLSTSYTVVNVWNEMKIKSSRWYTITVQGAQGPVVRSSYGSYHQSHTSGAHLQGSVFLKKGDVLRVLLGMSVANIHYGGKNGGGACVVLERQNETRFLFVAGGGGQSTATFSQDSNFTLGGDLPVTWCNATAGVGGCSGGSYLCSEMVENPVRQGGCVTSPIVTVESEKGRSVPCS